MCSHLVAVQTPQNNRKDDYNFGWFAEVSATKWTPTTQLAWGCRRTPKKGQPTNKSTHHQSLPHQQATQPTNSEWLRDLTYRTSSKRKWPLRHRAKTLAQLAPLAVAFHYDRLRMLRGNGSTVCHDKPVCDIQYSVVCPVQVSAKHLKKKIWWSDRFDTIDVPWCAHSYLYIQHDGRKDYLLVPQWKPQVSILLRLLCANAHTHTRGMFLSRVCRALLPPVSHDFIIDLFASPHGTHEWCQKGSQLRNTMCN